MLHDSQPDADDVTPPTVQIGPTLNPNRHDSGFRPAMRTPDPVAEAPHPADSEPATIHELSAPAMEPPPAADWEEESTTSKFPLSESRKVIASVPRSEPPPPARALDDVAPGPTPLAPRMPPASLPPPPSGRATLPPPSRPPRRLTPGPMRAVHAGDRGSVRSVPAAAPSEPQRVAPASHTPSSGPFRAAPPAPGSSSAPYGAAPAVAPTAPSQPSGVRSYPGTPYPPPVGYSGAPGFGGPTPSGTFTSPGASSAPWPRPAMGQPVRQETQGTTLAIVAVLAFVLGLTAGLAAGVAVGMRLL